jgi:hypothetical protein
MSEHRSREYGAASDRSRMGWIERCEHLISDVCEVSSIHCTVWVLVELMYPGQGRLYSLPASRKR